MPDLPSVTTLINSPPGQMVAGAALAGIVWKFFERIEAVLTDQTKFEIAVWLVGVEFVPTWRNAIQVFVEAICGPSAISLRCMTLAATVGTAAYISAFHALTDSYQRVQIEGHTFRLSEIVLINLFLWTVCVSISFISLMLIDYEVRRKPLGLWELTKVLLLLVIFFTLLFVMMFVWVPAIQSPSAERGIESILKEFTLVKLRWMVFPKTTILIAILVSTSWFWLYLMAALILKLMRRFDLGFDWFNRKFDIEKKPLSAIGLVAGALVAILYWNWVAFRHFHPA